MKPGSSYKFWRFWLLLGTIAQKEEVLLFPRLQKVVHRWRCYEKDAEIKATAKANKIGIWPSQPSWGVSGQERYH